MTDAFTDVPAFVTVVETGGFAAAGRKLNLSRSAVGKAVARLEGRLGVRLFHRTTRSQSLTEDGQAFHEHCQRALNELGAGRALLESGRQAIGGRLRVSVPVLFGRLCVVPVLTRLAVVHPRLELEVQFSDRPVDLIHDGFDLSVRMGAIGSGSGLMTRRIAREEMVICAAPAYLAAGAPTTLGELEHHAGIVYSRGGQPQKWRFPQGRQAPLEVAVRPRLRFDDLDAIADAAAAGLGLAWLPLWLVRDRLRSGALVQVLSDVPALGFDVHVMWPRAPHLPTRVRAAIDALAVEVARFIER